VVVVARYAARTSFGASWLKTSDASVARVHNVAAEGSGSRTTACATSPAAAAATVTRCAPFLGVAASGNRLGSADAKQNADQPRAPGPLNDLIEEGLKKHDFGSRSGENAGRLRGP
jgi:hypothetical protein